MRTCVETWMLERFREIALNVGVFRKEEIIVLEEVLNNIINASEYSYRLLYESFNDKIVGFIIFGRTPITMNTWDIYWLVVDREYQGKGFGKRLILRAQEEMLKDFNKIIIRLETSSLRQYSCARYLYEKMGFQKVGQIKDFYCIGDDLIIYAKELEKIPNT